jgi:GntR family transcriptional regulator/MocR family aminotransferase
MEAANKLRRTIDRQGDPLLERALSEFIKNGDLQRHLKKVVRVYRSRRDYFCKQLSTTAAGEVDFKKPDGGMSVWITFRKKSAIRKLSAALAKGHYVLDSSMEFASKFNSVRVGFASMTEKETDRFMKYLKESLG